MWRTTISIGRSAGRPIAVVLTLLATILQPAGAQDARDAAEGPSIARDSASIYVLEPLVVEGRFDDLTDIAVTASQGLVGHQDFRLRPLVREGELLETVPG
ncbi:MAG: hypothetical protein ACLFWG_06030, partial [Longimicrobiales bacterium]